MSKRLFDDSSDLVDVNAQSNGEQKDDASAVDTNPTEKQIDLLDEPIEVEETEEPEKKSKSKKSKAKRLFKRAKSPISGAINKTTKEFKKLSNLPKHHYTAPKSPQKSPSKENLTDEYKHLEDKIGEKSKASEEWMAFQQMQDRIKQTVLKTQNSLHKYSSHSEDEDQKVNKWTAFDEETEDFIDTTLRTGPAINVSCPTEEGETGNLLDLDQPKGKGKAPSPPSATGPLVDNSAMASVDDLMDIPGSEASGTVDILGIMDDPISTVSDSQSVPDTVKQNLFDLDSVLEPTSSVNVGEGGDQVGQVLSGYTFTTSVTGDTPMEISATEQPKTDYNDILMFEQPLSDEQLIAMSTKPKVPEEVPMVDGGQNLEHSMFESEPSHVDVAAIQPLPALSNEPIQPIPASVDVTAEQSVSTVDMDPIQPIPAPVDTTPLQPMDAVDTAVEPQSAVDSIPLQPTSAVDVPLQSVPAVDNPLEPLKPLSAVDVAPIHPAVALDATPLQPISAKDFAPLHSSAGDQVVPSTNVDVLAGFEDLDTFDPMKSTGFQEIPKSPAQSAFNPFKATQDSQVYGTSPQTQSYGPPPIEHDIMSKIRKMSSSSAQPISPVRKSVSKPADPFGFVKKELGCDEDDGSYKSMADLQKSKQPQLSETEVTEEDPFDQTTSNVNNPFLSGDFNEDFSSKEISVNAAAVFGVEDDSFKFEVKAEPASDLDSFLGGTDERKTPWTDVSAANESSNMWGDSDVLDNASGGDVWDMEEKKVPGVGDDAWGTEPAAIDKTASGEVSNPFQQDDFSKLDDIPFEEPKEAIVNPFLSNDAPVTTAVHNPFLNLEDQPEATDPLDDLLGSKPVVLSDSESFFLDSVHDTQQVTEEADDIFDPFKVTKKEVPDTQQIETEAPVDMFTAAAASGDKQLVKPSSDDHSGFTLEIKPVSKDGSEKPTFLPAPILKPPPKPPKSPQPPRINPFNRDSPPEENFAQFEVKETEKPKEPPPKSISTDSTMSEEEPEQPLEPLEPFLPKLEKEGFKLMLRYPTKKKIAGNRYWKTVFVKIVKQSEGPMVKVFSDANDALPMQDLLLQACYSLSDVCLQQYDQYGKIHAVKLQYVFYKERVGIKTERIAPSMMKFKKREKPKATMILDHSPQVSELLKFGSLDKAEIILFIHAIEDALMNLEAHREKTLTYSKDEITAEVRDEYVAELDKFGKVISQKGRVRIFVLAFLTGMPIVEVGLNDKRRRGKEVVGRCDIIPIKTEEWIKLEDVEFHHCVNKEEFEKTNNIKFHPLDACQFELLRFRVRPRENKELPLQLTVQQIFKERKCEVRCDLLVTGYHSYSKKHGQFPCEDIEVRFPIPEHWIYMFRYERRFGYGSIHSSLRKPGKIKGLERLTMMAQGISQTLMEADVGTAKYEHVYRAVVWRIPRLPVRNQGAYTSHLFRLKLELGPHDEIPDSFENTTFVEFSMPCSTVSQSQIRSIAVTNQNPPEKWVRSMAKYNYTIEIEHLDEYPEIMSIGNVYKSAATTNSNKSDEEPEQPEERDPRLAVSDTDSSDSD